MKYRGAIYRGKRVENRARSGCVKALFWGPKKVEAAASTDFSLGEFNLTASSGTEVNVCILLILFVVKSNEGRVISLSF